MKCMKRIAFESDEELDWITVKGNHIPIKKGQDKGDAIADFFDKKKDEKSTNLAKTMRDTSYDIIIKEKEFKIEEIKRQSKPDDKLIQIYRNEIDKVKKLKENDLYKFENMSGIFMENKPNTHTKMDRGFKAENTKINIGASMSKKDLHPLKKERFDNIIDTVKTLWNELPDEYRDYVGELKIHNVRGYHGTKMGTYTHSRKMTEKDSRVLTMRIDQSDKPHEIIHTFLHEMGHAIWHNKFRNNQEKIDKFRKGVNELIETNGGITKYVQNDHVEMNEILKIKQEFTLEKYRNTHIDSEDMSGEDITMKIEYHKKQLDQIVADETHSEAISFILGGFTKWELGDNIDKPTMEKYFKLVEELHND